MTHQKDTLAKLAEIPPAASEDRDFWLEAARQHGFEETSGGEQVPEYDPPAYFATEDEVLRLMSDARKQGQRDVLAARPTLGIEGLTTRNPAPHAAAPHMPGPGYRVMQAGEISGHAPFTPITLGSGTKPISPAEREATGVHDDVAVDRALDAFFGHLPHPDKPWGGAWRQQMRNALRAARGPMDQQSADFIADCDRVEAEERAALATGGARHG